MLKIGPSLHGNLTAVELALSIVVTSLGLLTSRLASITPREVVELPISIGWQDEVPNWEGEEVDEHPCNIRDAMGGQNDENARETKNQR